MMKRQIVFLATMAATLLMAFGGVAAQAGGSDHAATAQQASQEQGLVIVSVDSSGPAAAAGVKRGDILLDVDGQKTDQARDVLQVLSSLQPGDKIQVQVLHGDNQRTLDLTVGDRNGKPYLGLQPYFGSQSVTLPEAETTMPAGATVPGALIVEVVANSPAADADLQVGDVITAVDGKALDQTADLASAIGQYKPGETVTLEVAKAGSDSASSKITVTLGENPDQANKPLLGVRYRAAVEADQDNEETMPFRFHGGQVPFGMPGAVTGAVVQSVVKDSPAASAGLQQGDVITGIDDTAVTTPQDLVDAVGAKKPGDTVALTVTRSGETAPLTVKATLGENPDKAGKAYLGVSIGAAMMRLRSNGQTPDDSGFNFRLPFSLDNLPFDLNNLPLPFQLEQPTPSGQDPA